MSNSYRSATAKSNLKLVAGSREATAEGSKPKQLRAGGLEPDASMKPGQYRAACDAAKATSSRGMAAAMQWRVVEGPHSGTALKGWIPIDEINGIVVAGSRYYRKCAIALGREIESGDSLDPADVFPGKVFLVEVGYAKTDKPTGGPTTKPDNQLHHKGPGDYLRVHLIVEAVEWA